MITRNMIRGVVIGGVVTVVGLVMTGESRGFFNFWQKRYNAAAAMYGGTVCNPCGQQLVCNYVPQTCYRVQYCTVPVTTYRPVTSCDPCTGCPTTCMRPMTQYVQQPQYVPYTTYRLQYSYAQPACPTPTTSYYAAPSGCSTCGTGVVSAAYQAPAASYAAPSGCASCGVRNMNTTYYAPSASYAAPAYATIPGGMAPTYSSAPPTGATTYNYAPSSSAPSYSGPTYSNPSTVYYYPPASPPPTSSGSPTPTTVTVNPSTSATPSPTPAPAATGTQTDMKPIAPHETLKPIPDPLTTDPENSKESEKPAGPKLGPTSTPRLFDLHDKTAAAWPVNRAWAYTAVGAVTAARTVTPAAHTTIEPSASLEIKPATLGAPIMIQPQATPTRSTIDADGWRSVAR